MRATRVTSERAREKEIERDRQRKSARARHENHIWPACFLFIRKLPGSSRPVVSTGLASAGIATPFIFNPISALCISTAICMRWTMIGHHVCHGGYNAQVYCPWNRLPLVLMHAGRWSERRG